MKVNEDAERSGLFSATDGAGVPDRLPGLEEPVLGAEDAPDGALRFVVVGTPRPGGSKNAFPLPTGPPIKGVGGHRRGTVAVAGADGVLRFGRVNVTDASGAPGKEWRKLVQGAAVDAKPIGSALMRGPLGMELVFFRERPQAHFDSKGVLKAKAPALPVVVPDVLKLARAVEDSLKGILFEDDVQIVVERIEKRYGSPARCEVALWTL